MSERGTDALVNLELGARGTLDIPLLVRNRTLPNTPGPTWVIVIAWEFFGGIHPLMSVPTRV